MSTRQTGPSQWLVNRRHEREQIMSAKSHSVFDRSPPPPLENEAEEASGSGEVRKGSILVIESDTEHEESSSSESEPIEGTRFFVKFYSVSIFDQMFSLRYFLSGT